MKAAPVIGAGIGAFLGWQLGGLAAVALFAYDASDGDVQPTTLGVLLVPFAGLVGGAYLGYRIGK